MIAAIFAAPIAFASTGQGRAAELIVRNARVVTLDTKNTIAEAIVVRDGRIVFTGSNQDSMRYAQRSTRIIDAGKRTIIPGLIDSHIHAIRAGLTSGTDVTFSGARTITQAMAQITQAADETSPDGWIVVAGGWTEQQFAEGRRPSRAEILKFANGRHVFMQLFYRAAFISPGGLKALGLDVNALPLGATAERDGNNRLTGWIKGNAAAITALYSKLPKADLAKRVTGTRRFFSKLNAYGVTGVIDPGGHNLNPADYAALFNLWRRKQLTIRVTYSICAPSPGHELEEYRRYTTFMPMGFGDSYLRFNGIGERVIWDFYNKDNPTREATSRFEDVARWAARNRLTMTVHWNKEASVRHLLAALERVARSEPFADLRWSIAHLHDATPATIKRLKSLNLGWLTQNAYYFAAPSFVAEHSGRLKAAPPLASAIQTGLKIGGGTDATRVMTYNPFAALQWMIDGRTIAGIPTRGAAERISREQALRVWTQGSAWFAFAEKDRGALLPGMLADFAVLSKDYLSVPVEEIGSIRSVLTIVGGRIVHASAPFKSR